jgi:hypothetical protein
MYGYSIPLGGMLHIYMYVQVIAYGTYTRGGTVEHVPQVWVGHHIRVEGDWAWGYHASVGGAVEVREEVHREAKGSRRTEVLS